MALPQPQQLISLEQYLAGELLSDIKHQLIDGEVYAMSGASANHNLLTGNIFSEFKMRLKGTHCQTFMADMKLKFESLGITIAVDDIYDQVDNEDVLHYWQQKQQIIPSSPASE